uniref:Uncharacterized protein n=1 Tax=Romanomermis culicivorax TaxID=13658 RepID=A0A915JYV9_ROMCU
MIVNHIENFLNPITGAQTQRIQETHWGHVKTKILLKTAFGTSDASARVGRGHLTIDSNICVAQMTGLPAWLHLAIIIFCATTTSYKGISWPMSPLATMTPSDASIISSMLE